MDTNNNASDASEIDDQGLAIKSSQESNESDEQQQDTLQIRQESDQQENIIKPESRLINQIELHADYDASDVLDPDSGTQTPIEDETSGNTNHDKQTDNDDSSARNQLGADDDSKEQKSGIVCVKESESDEAESIEIELEGDNSLLLTSLTSLFPEASGLKYRHPGTNTLRGVKLSDGKFLEPIDGWAAVSNYICVFNRGSKRKAEDDDDSSRNKQVKTDVVGEDGSDLVVLGLPWTTTEDSMRNYFEQYGEVNMVQVKTDPKSGKSRGFGFVRFAKSSIQTKLLSMRHFIDGRWCDVRVPLSKAEADATKAAQLSRKIFVGRLPDNITTEELRNHFSSFGTLTDVYIPKPFRNFAFVTFGTSDMAQSIFKHKHVINGTTVQISEAIPRDNAPANYAYSGPQSTSSSNYATPSYGGLNNNSIHPFNNSSYGIHQPAAHHHYGNKTNVTGFSASAYPGGRKPQHQQQSSYYQMPSYAGSGPSSGSMDSSYINHNAHSDYANFGSSSTSGSYNQASGGLNGQYYKLQQHQVMAQQHPSHGTSYPPQSSYSGHGANFSRNPYGSVWK